MARRAIDPIIIQPRSDEAFFGQGQKSHKNPIKSIGVAVEQGIWYTRHPLTVLIITDTEENTHTHT